MRILAVGNMYPPHHLGGYELTWRSAVEHFRGSGHEVGVLTTDFRVAEPDPVFPEDPAARRELRWYWHDHGWPRLSAPERIALERHNGRVFERQLRDLRPDVVNWWAMGGMSLSLIERVRRAGIPSVGVVGDDWMVYSPIHDGWQRMVVRLRALGPVLGQLAGVPTRVDFRDAEWLFNSETTRDHALRHSGFEIPRAEILHPGIDTGLFREAPAHEWAWRLLYVGRLDERKGVDAAIKALAHLPREATLRVLGAGDRRYGAELRALCRHLGLEDRVELDLLPRGELPGAYAEADAVLFPVRWEEPWGLVPLEAMAMGTPVIATGTGGSGEYLRHRENALVVGRDAEPPDLAAAVKALAADPGLRQRLRQQGQHTAGRYTEQAYNESILSALERAVA